MARKRTTSLDIVINGKNRTKREFGGVERQLARMRKTAVAMGVALAGAFSARVIGRQVSEAVRLFGIQEKAERRLEDALRLAGDASRESAEDIKKFASQIQSMTTLGDEAVIEMAALGASLGKLSGQQLKDATTAAIGLSKALGVDTTAAMRLVSRAAVGDTAQLTRYGIKLDETLTDQEKFNQLLKIGATNFDIAKGEAQTFTGRLQQVKNVIGDVREEIGRMVASVVMDMIPSVKRLVVNIRDAFGLKTQGDMNEVRSIFEEIGDKVTFVALKFEELSIRASIAFTKFEAFLTGNLDDAFTNLSLANLRKDLEVVQKQIDDLGKPRKRPEIPSPVIPDTTKQAIAEAVKVSIKTQLPRTQDTRFLTGANSQADPLTRAQREQAKLAKKQVEETKKIPEEIRALGRLLNQLINQRAEVFDG